jgi:histone-lysine N-methyltransferase SETMAR
MKKKSTADQAQFESSDFLFDIRGTVHIDGVPEGQTVNQVYYKVVLTTLPDWVIRKRPDMWKNGSWILHHDNALADNALSAKTFLAKHKIPVLEHPPFSPAIALRDIFFISKNQVSLRGTPFKSVDAVTAKVMKVMKKLSEKDLQHSFQQWKIRMSCVCIGKGTTLVITFPLCE